MISKIVNLGYTNVIHCTRVECITFLLLINTINNRKLKNNVKNCKKKTMECKCAEYTPDRINKTEI